VDGRDKPGHDENEEIILMQLEKSEMPDAF
jgi:hypothetical protein